MNDGNTCTLQLVDVSSVWVVTNHYLCYT